MNWLAHLYLSEPDPECRLGNLLADFVKPKERDGFTAKMHHGIRCHLVIDAFTDFHIVVGRSKARIQTGLRRFAGILVDMFYDHFLARNWSRYADVSLEAFTNEIHAALQETAQQVSTRVQDVVDFIVTEDLLSSYQYVDAIEDGLGRLSRRLTARLRRPIALAPGIDDLKTHYNELETDFHEFFPELQAHVATWQAAPS